MPPRLQQLLSSPRAVALRRRVTPFVLVLLAHILIIFVLMTLAPPRHGKPGDGSRLTVIQLNEPRPEPKAEKQRKVVMRTKRAVARPTPPAPVPPPEMPIELRNLLRIDLAKSDIAKMQSAKPAETATAAAETGTEAAEESAAFTGPGGEKLYEADWYTRPTQAQMGFYMPRNGSASGFGLIACRTVPRYRVEDCVALAESPGSGLAQAVLQAAWQFRVLPPRVGDRALVGAWVRIRIDYTRLPAK